MKTAAWIVAAFIALGIVSGGGLVRQPDGSVDVGATLERGADEGGEIAGRAADDLGNGLGSGLGSAVGESDLAKMAAAGVGAAAVAKYGPKFRAKPVTVPPVTATTKPPKKPVPVSPAPTLAPMSPGFTAPTFRLPEPSWKPCAASPGIIVSC